VIIEKARREQLGAIDEVISDAIVNLCEQDHMNQVQHIETWLAQRSPGILEQLLFSGDAQGFVCIIDGHIVGIAHINAKGQMKLCYVHSEYTGRGIGRALVAAVEQQAGEWGLEQITMTSTKTAKDFYLTLGYSQSSDPIPCFGMPGYPLKKQLKPGSEHVLR